jgi:hypothetical protein
MINILENLVPKGGKSVKETLKYDPHEGDVHYQYVHKFLLAYKDETFTFSHIFMHSSYGYECGTTSRIKQDSSQVNWDVLLKSWDASDDVSDEVNEFLSACLEEIYYQGQGRNCDFGANL